MRLVTLGGPGGIGKTRLALRLAETVRGDFADGVIAVPLAPVRAAELVMPAIARNLGVRPGTARPTLDRLSAFLRNREMLLVLDNFEQVTEASPALGELLLACPHLKVLVTSRAPLHISGEHLFAVPPLALPHAEGAIDARPLSLATLGKVEAVQLFVDRAQAASPDFVLSTVNAPVIAAICQRTDGLPLAIELAAARTAVLSLPDLLDRLSHQLKILRGGPRDQPLRLRSMTDAIAWSYHLLSPHEQAFFRRLAVFVGGVSLDAAETVADGGWRMAGEETPPASRLPPPASSVLDLLTALVDQSLLQRAVGPGGATRYAMLETVREYGLERLAASGEEPAVRNAHADWCTALAERAGPELSGPRQLAWFDRLEAEHPNMRAALTFLLEREDAERGVRLALALSWFWSSRGYLREGFGWFETLLALPVAIPPSVRAFGIREAANMAQWQGDLDRAGVLVTEALVIFRAQHDRLQAAYSLRQLGSIAIDRGRLEEAASYLAEGWESLRSVATPWDAAFTTYLWGRLAAASDRFEEAEERFAEAAAAFAEVGDRAYVAAATGRRAAAWLRLGGIGAARTAYAETLRLAQELHEQIWVAWALVGAAHMAVLDSRPETGARLLGATLAIRETTGEGGYGDDLAPEVRAVLMAPRYAAARARGAVLPQARMIAEAFAVLEAGEVKRRRPQVGALGQRVLTARERDVLRLLVDGLSDKEIAAALGISRYTASNHVTAIRDKLGAPSRAAVVAIAIRDGLV